MNCPNCNSVLLKENINIQTDVAQCINCDLIFKISETLDHNEKDGFSVDNPPSGAWISKEMDNWKIGATTRSPIAFFLVPFMIVWSGFSLGGIYGSQIISGEFSLLMSLFGIPFLAGSIIFWSFAIMTIWGKVEITLDTKGGKVFTGVGRIGYVQKFYWNEISAITEKPSNFKYPGSQGEVIQIEGQKRTSFGIGVNASRRYYLIKVLKNALLKVKAKKSFLNFS